MTSLTPCPAGIPNRCDTGWNCSLNSGLLPFHYMWTRILKCCCLTRVTVPSPTTLSLVILVKHAKFCFFSKSSLHRKKVPCLQITTTLSAFYVRGPKFLCTAKGVRFYHSRNVLGSCCTLWELVQDINCPWGFNLLSFHHNMDYIFNTLPHIFILHKIVSPHFIFPCHLLFFHFFKFHILPSSNFKILQWSNPEYQLRVNLE